VGFVGAEGAIACCRWCTERRRSPVPARRPAARCCPALADGGGVCVTVTSTSCSRARPSTIR
jgi:hypothetical protein